MSSALTPHPCPRQQESMPTCPQRRPDALFADNCELLVAGGGVGRPRGRLLPAGGPPWLLEPAPVPPAAWIQWRGRPGGRLLRDCSELARRRPVILLGWRAECF